jgi:hypothetical protein
VSSSGGSRSYHIDACADLVSGYACTGGDGYLDIEDGGRYEVLYESDGSVVLQAF